MGTRRAPAKVSPRPPTWLAWHISIATWAWMRFAKRWKVLHDAFIVEIEVGRAPLRVERNVGGTFEHGEREPALCLRLVIELVAFSGQSALGQPAGMAGAHRCGGPGRRRGRRQCRGAARRARCRCFPAGPAMTARSSSKRLVDQSEIELADAGVAAGEVLCLAPETMRAGRGLRRDRIRARPAARARRASAPAAGGKARSGPTTAKRSRAHRSLSSLASLLFIAPSPLAASWRWR